MSYPLFSLFARADENDRLTDIVRLFRIKTGAEYRRRWQETAQTIIDIEGAGLNMDDELEVKGRRILSLAALLEDGLEFHGPDVTYAEYNPFVKTLPKDLPGFDALLPRLKNAMHRYLTPHGPWAPYKRSFYIPIQSYDPEGVMAQCGVEIPA